jgi:nucleotide-binding universal stress UspA family protein
MAIKDILLHLDNSLSCLEKIELAVSLAKLHAAHLKGLYLKVQPYYAPGNLTVAETAGRIESLFRDKAANAGISAEFIFVDCSVAVEGIPELISSYSYYSDLLIVSQSDHGTHKSVTPLDLPQRLGFGAGRPVLIVPYTGHYTGASERVMIAWRSGRESSRVVNDSMPILKKAHLVRVVTVDSPGSSEERTANDVNKLCDYLARHGIAAKHDPIIISSSFPVGDVLLNHACEHKMDLLVMGAFSANRIGVFTLGSVSRHLLNHMTLPVLISH